MKSNRPLKILFLLNSIFTFAGSLFGPLYAIYVQSIDNKIMSISFSWAVFLLSSTFFMYFIRKYGDKIKEQEFLLAGGFLIRSMAWFAYIFVTDLTSLLVVQVLLGLGEAVGSPSWNAIFAKHLDKEKEILEYSSWIIVRNLMVAMGTIIGGLLVTYFGFNFIFITMGLLTLISFFGILLTPREVL